MPRASTALLAVAITLSGTLAAFAQSDALMAARLAQRDGDFATCARQADIARRLPRNTYHAHRLFAACTVTAADARKAELEPAAYRAEIEKAIAALQTLLSTPSAQHQPKARDIISFSIAELRRKIEPPAAAK